MVGVAGKSQGCATCRRRKIKCDTRKPSCARCERSKLACEGYERYPVFIDRTQTGFRKRKPLEETKKSSQVAVVSLASPDAEAAGLISWFWKSFSHSPPSRHALLSPSHWLDHFLPGYPLCLPLKNALLAVSVTRLSKTTGRPEMLMEGRRLYTQALTLTRNALKTSDQVLKDNILATTCVMVIYELLDATGDGMHGWLNHLAGISRLMQHRGPKLHASAAARAVFEHSRYLLMLQHLLARKGSVFSQPAWIAEPWKDVRKGVEQQVFDEGLRLAALFERSDVAAEQALSVSEAIELFEECTELYNRLQLLLDEQIVPKVVLEFDKVPWCTAPSEGVAYPASFLLRITALGLQLGACASANEVLSQIIEPSLTGLDLQRAVSSSIRRILEQTIHLSSNRRRLAEQIIRCISFCLNERMGSMGAARMIFSLRLAIKQFQPAEPGFDQCQMLLNRLSSKASKFDGLLRSNQSITANIVLYDKANLVQENANSIVQQWLRFADYVGCRENLLKEDFGNVESTASALCTKKD